MKRIFLPLLLATVFSQDASAHFITLTAQMLNGTNYFDSVTLATNQSIEVRTIFENGFRPNGGPPGSVNLVIRKGGKEFYLPSTLFLNGTNGMRLPVVFAGPATVTLENLQTPAAFATVEIKTDSFPPDKTLIVPGDSNGANVIMESSTDLVNWFAASPGAYTNRTNNLFFRIRADRIP